jgi:hypothetical protein
MLNRLIEAALVVVLLAAAVGQLPRLVSLNGVGMRVSK